ncbi:MAG: V-type ATP synthase subunit I [Spirochaetales bacterium]|jgi:V/A-type H+-transporting ATPase subunit I|nr:V-type ATP synthase subunit I [Spirochaetales bacterium]
MIVPMKKVSLVMLDTQKETALKALRKAGLVHITGLAPSGDQLAALETQRALVEKCLFALPPQGKGGPAPALPKGKPDRETLLKLCGEIEALTARLAALRDENQGLLKEEERIGFLGDFDPQDLKTLEERGISLRLYALSKDELARLSAAPPDPRVFVLSRTKTGGAAAVVLKPGEGTETLLEGLFNKPPLEPPLHSLSVLQHKFRANQASQALAQAKLGEYGAFAPALKEGLALLAGEIEFEKVRSGAGQEETLAYLTGWCPLPGLKDLKARAAENSWALLVQDPEGEDEPPSLVQNNRLVRIIAPVFTFLGVVPGYREYDISRWFLLFLSVFTAMIIGDGGYGLLFLGVCIIVRIKTKKTPDFLRLAFLVSFLTIAWGSITGTWFGSAEIAALPFFKALQIPAISNANPLSQKNMMMLCFVIALIHLFLAHLKNIIRYRSSLRALADLGTMSMIWGFFNLVLFLVIDPQSFPVQPASIYFIAGGFAAVVLFGQQERGQSFLRGALKGVAGLFQTFLGSISNFSDIISYIRLFAVGLATLAISESFNTMALGIPGFFGIIAMVLILLFGHGLNIIMALLSVVVHGVRLNLLEFSGHLGMEWTGVEYAPFKEREFAAPSPEESGGGGGRVPVSPGEENIKTQKE